MMMTKPGPLRWLIPTVVLFAVTGCVYQPAIDPDATPEQRNAAQAAHVHATALRYEARLAEVPQFEASDAEARQADRDSLPLVWVDCRTPREQRVSMLPGAITQTQLEANPDRYRDARLVVYCTIGVRSTRYTDRLRRQGFDAANLRGGVLAWAHAGGAFVDPQGRPTRAVHTYGRPWDWLPTGYRSVR